MNDTELLLDAIINNPDEDTPRLEYADEIRANGDEDRAEFIQLQIALERGAPDDPKRPEMAARNDELLQRCGDAWASVIAGPQIYGVRFRRGFIEEVWTTRRGFMDLGDRVGRVPLRVAHLTNVSGGCDALAHSHNIHQIDTLVIDDVQFGDSDLASLIAGNGPQRLTKLLLVWGRAPGRNVITDNGVAALAGSRLFRRLSALSLHVRPGLLGSPAVEALALASSGSGLKQLQLIDSAVDDQGAAALAESRFEELADLRIIGSRIRNAGMVALATSPRLRNLETLAIRSAHVNNTGMRELARKGVAGHLRRLTISSRAITPRAAASIDTIRVASPGLQLDIAPRNDLPPLLPGPPDDFGTRLLDSRGEGFGPRVVG